MLLRVAQVSGETSMDIFSACAVKSLAFVMRHDSPDDFPAAMMPASISLKDLCPTAAHYTMNPALARSLRALKHISPDGAESSMTDAERSAALRAAALTAFPLPLCRSFAMTFLFGLLQMTN